MAETFLFVHFAIRVTYEVIQLYNRKRTWSKSSKAVSYSALQLIHPIDGIPRRFTTTAWPVYTLWIPRISRSRPLSTGFWKGDGYVGSVDGQQPIEVIVESSQRVTFQDMDVRSANGENIFSEPIEIGHKAQSIPNRGEHKNILNVQNQGPVVFERRSMYPALAYG